MVGLVSLEEMEVLEKMYGIDMRGSSYQAFKHLRLDKDSELSGDLVSALILAENINEDDKAKISQFISEFCPNKDLPLIVRTFGEMSESQ